jgi:hypothetical protein
MGERSKIVVTGGYVRSISIILLAALLLSIGLLAFIHPPVHAAPTRVNTSTCGGSSGSLTCTIPAPADGNTLVAVVQARKSGSVLYSMSQTGATWTEAGSSSSTNVEVSIWYANNVSGAGTSVTITGGTKLAATIVEYSGLASSSVLDAVSGGGNAGTSNAPDTGTTSTTAQASELWVGGMANVNTNTYSAQTNGFTEIAESATTGGSPATKSNSVYEEKVVSTTGAANVGATLSGSVEWVGIIATFNAAIPPSQAVFTTTARTLTAGICSGAANIITVELQDASNIPRAPTGTTTINISTSSSSASFYSDSSCATPISGGNISFATTDTAKSFYVVDTAKSNPTWTLTASQTSGPDTLSNGTQAITVNAGAVTRLVVTLPGQTFTDGVGNSGSISNQTAGSSFNLVKISATDDYFNVNSGYTGAKTLSYSGPSNAPLGTPPSFTTSVSFTSGQSTTTLATTLYKAETTSITATEGGLYGYASSPVTINPATVGNYVVIGATPTIAGVCATANSITARDQYNNTISSDSSVVNMTTTGTGITFYTTSGCSTTTTQYTLSGGTATFFFKSTKKQSGFTITATKNLDTPTGSTSSLAIDPAAASTLLVQLPNQSFVDGTGITGSANFTGLRTPNATASTSFTVNLKAVDAFNNLVDTGVNNYTGSKTMSWASSVAGNAPDSTSPSYPVGAVSFSSGSASGLSITYHNAATGRTVRADDTGTPVTGTASSTFIVQAGSTASYTVSAGASQTAGVAFNATITAVDTHQNGLGSLYTAPAGTYTWSTTAANAPDSTPPNMGSLIQANFTNGVATKSVTLYNAQSGVTLTAAEPGPSSVTGTSAAISVTAGSISGAATDSSITGNSIVTRGSPLTVTITLYDTWHNPKAGVGAANIIVSGTNTPTINQPASATDASGQTTADLTWSALGAQTVSVQISGVSLVQNDGVTPDANGFLDNTLSTTVSLTGPGIDSVISGGTTIRGGTKVQ